MLVTPRGLPGSSVDSALEPLGLTRRVVLRVPHFVSAAMIVARTDMVVTVPAALATQVAPRLGLAARPVPFPMRGFTWSIGYSASFRDDPAHRWFRELVIAATR